MNKKLDDMKPIKHPFKVEDGYFDELTKNIQNKVSPEKEVSTVFKWQWVLAPVMILVITFFIWLNLDQSTNPNSQELIAQVSTTDIITYLEYSDLSEQDLLMLTNDETLQDLSDIDEINLEEPDLEDLMNNFDLNDLDI